MRCPPSDFARPPVRMSRTFGSLSSRTPTARPPRGLRWRSSIASAPASFPPDPAGPTPIFSSPPFTLPDDPSPQAKQSHPLVALPSRPPLPSLRLQLRRPGRASPSLRLRLGRRDDRRDVSAVVVGHWDFALRARFGVYDECRRRHDQGPKSVGLGSAVVGCGRAYSFGGRHSGVLCMSSSIVWRKERGGRLAAAAKPEASGSLRRAIDPVKLLSCRGQPKRNDSVTPRHRCSTSPYSTSGSARPPASAPAPASPADSTPA